MNKLIIALFLFVAPSLGFSESEKKLVIVRDQNPDNPHHRQTTVFTLTKEPSGIACETGSIPKHRIRVKGLRLAGPSSIKGLSAKGCKDTVQWGNKKFCYERNADPQLDEIFRQCVNL